MVIGAGTAEAYSGGSVDVPITIQNNPGIGGFSFDISYDESLLTLLSIEAGALIKDTGIFSTSGKIVSRHHTSSNNITSDGTLINLRFRINSSAERGRTPVGISLRNGKDKKNNLVDAGNKPVEAVFQGNMVGIKGGLLGDMTGDGILTMADVTIFNRAVIEDITLDQRQERLSRLSGSDYISMSDVTKLINIILGSDSQSRAGKRNAIENRALKSTASITVGNGSVPKGGGKVSLPVMITGNSGIYAFGFTVTVPEGYTFDSVEKGDLLSDEKNGVIKSEDNNNVSWLKGDQTYVTGDGVLFKIDLTASADAQTGPVSVALIGGHESNLCDKEAAAVPVGFKEGTVTVTDGSIDPDKKDISQASVDAIPDQVYTGQAIEPTVTVKDGNKTLTEGTDYTVTYQDNKNAGTATVTITGKGSYTGSTSQTFIIKRSTTEDAKTKIKVGSASVPKEGGEVSLPVEIIGNSGISAFRLKLMIPDGYTLDSVETGTLLKDKGEVKKGVNGQITWYNPSGKNVAGDGILFKIHLIAEKDAPPASISITLMDGKEDDLCDEKRNAIPVVFEEGTLTVSSESIRDDTKPTPDTKKDISKTSISKIPDQAYTGWSITPNVTVKDGNKTLREGTDHTVSYSNNKNVGTAKIRITGKGNYTGIKTVQFRIKRPQPVNSTKIIYAGGGWMRVKTTKAGKAMVTKVTPNSKSIAIPSKVTVDRVSYTVTTIGSYAFYRADKVTKITVPRSVKTIQKNAFKGAKKLKTLKLDINKASQTKIQKGAFSGLNTKKMSIKVNISTNNKMLKNIRKSLKKAGFKGRVSK